MDHNFDISSYTVGLYAGGVLLAEDSNLLNPANGTFLQSIVSFGTGATHAQLGQPLEIRLGAQGLQTSFDNVQLTAVPEPASLLMCGLAVGVVSMVRRRRCLSQE